MNARERLEAMVRTDRASTTVWSERELNEALDAYRDELLADVPPGQLPDTGWQAEMETTRVARLVVHRLRQQHAAGAGGHSLTAEESAALAAEFDRMRTLLADSWRRAADKLEATPHTPTALTGPYWYGQGWDDAVERLRDLADYMEP
ncbi:hypothetical protein [Kitasatospora sp. NPDC004272]